MDRISLLAYLGALLDSRQTHLVIKLTSGHSGMFSPTPWSTSGSTRYVSRRITPFVYSHQERPYAGRRLVFLLGTSWLGIWGIGCGFAPNEISLDIMRALQGLGTAAAIPSAIGILAGAFQEGTTIRTVAFATFSSGAPIGAAVGNVIGSLLTQYSRYVLHEPSCAFPNMSC